METLVRILKKNDAALNFILFYCLKWKAYYLYKVTNTFKKFKTLQHTFVKVNSVHYNLFYKKIKRKN
jgi:hypothetical protein